MDRVSVPEGLFLSDVHVGCPSTEFVSTSHYQIMNFEAMTGSLGGKIFISKDLGVRQLKKTITDRQDSSDSEEEQVDMAGASVEVDEGGDLILLRPQKRPRKGSATLIIHHAMGTTLEAVGLQVWRGALLLADFILQDLERWRDLSVVELGAGTGKLTLPLVAHPTPASHHPTCLAGLVGIAAARAARRVFITDRGEGILDNCVRNVVCNCHGAAYSTTPLVRHLDWEERWPPAIAAHPPPVHGWLEEEVREASEADVLLAADVVYSEEITHAFFEMLGQLMPSGSSTVLYLALEKRYNFSLDDRAVVATGYEHFRSFFVEQGSVAQVRGEKGKSGPVALTTDEDSGAMEMRSCTPQFSDKKEMKSFMGTKLEFNDVRQCILDYERGKDLELWEIRRQ